MQYTFEFKTDQAVEGGDALYSNPVFFLFVKVYFNQQLGAFARIDHRSKLHIDTFFYFQVTIQHLCSGINHHLHVTNAGQDGHLGKVTFKNLVLPINFGVNEMTASVGFFGNFGKMI